MPSVHTKMYHNGVLFPRFRFFSHNRVPKTVRLHACHLLVNGRKSETHFSSLPPPPGTDIKLHPESLELSDGRPDTTR